MRTVYPKPGSGCSGIADGLVLKESEKVDAIACMGIRVAASECPHVHAAVCESVPAARRCAAANNANLLAMGAFYVAPRTAMAMADAFLELSLGSGYEDWDGFYEYHRIGYDECENFDYEAYKADGFEVVNPGFAVLAEQPKGLAY